MITKFSKESIGFSVYLFKVFFFLLWFYTNIEELWAEAHTSFRRESHIFFIEAHTSFRRESHIYLIPFNIHTSAALGFLLFAIGPNAIWLFKVAFSTQL